DGAHRLAGALEGEYAVDVRAELALANPCHDRLGRAPGVVRAAVRPGADEDADDRVVLQQGQVHGQGRNLATGESDRHQPPLEGHQPGKRGEQRAADVIDADVEASATGEVLDAGAHVFARMVDDVVCTTLADNSRLCGAADDGDDPCTERMRDLDAGQ